MAVPRSHILRIGFHGIPVSAIVQAGVGERR